MTTTTAAAPALTRTDAINKALAISNVIKRLDAVIEGSSLLEMSVAGPGGANTGAFSLADAATANIVKEALKKIREIQNHQVLEYLAQAAEAEKI